MQGKNDIILYFVHALYSFITNSFLRLKSLAKLLRLEHMQFILDHLHIKNLNHAMKCPPHIQHQCCHNGIYSYVTRADKYRLR